MKSCDYNTGDVLLITRNGEECLAQIARFTDQLDDSKPLYCHLRVSDGQRWSRSVVRVTREQIIKRLPNWYEEQRAKHEASIKETADVIYARMSPAQRERRRQQAERRRSRFPLDILIDQACGLE